MKIPTTGDELNSARIFYRTKQIPAAALRVMDAATAKLEAGGVVEAALKTGDTVPDFILPGMDGSSVRLYTELERGPVVLVFYRGRWCPYCNIHLRGFQKSFTDFTAAGVRIITISPQLPDQALTTQETNEIAFPVLSDIGLHTAHAFGVAFDLPKPLLDLYAGFGHPLELANGPEGATELPMPATFVIRTDRTIAYTHVEADYTQRAEPLEVLEVARKL